MELTKEFIEANKLDDAQVAAITGYVKDDYIPTLKKDWDGKANTDAEGIISGAVKATIAKNGIDLPRDQGEKLGDWLVRYSDNLLTSQKGSLATKQKEYDDKLADFKGGDEYKQQLADLATALDDEKKKVAELDPLKGLDVKYKESQDQLSGLKLQVAFRDVKPTFPDEVNEYEAKAKWDAFTNGVLKTHNIELVDGEAVAIDKDNEHKTVKLADLVKQDADITKLLEGRQQGGTGAKGKDFQQLEGIPFAIPKGATSEELSSLVREHVTKKLGDPLHTDFPKEFSQLLSKIKEKQTA